MKKLFLILLLPLSVYSQYIDFSKTPQDNVDSLRYYMNQELNEYRLQNNVNELEMTDKLNEFAQAWAKTMFETGELKHSKRPFNSGENIFYGSNRIFTLKEFSYWRLQTWKESSGHNKNMLDNWYTKSGYGFYEGYAVQIFE